MAHHVGVGVVDYHESELLARELAQQLVGDFHGAHLRLLVVGGHIPRTGDEDASLARHLLLDPPVEEESDVSVLLGLGDVQLMQPVLGQHLGQHMARTLGREDDRQRELLLVLSHGDDIDDRRVRPAVEEVELLLEEGPCELADAVGAEVEEQTHVAVSDRVSGVDCRVVGTRRRRAAGDHRGAHELVRLAALVCGGHRLRRRSRMQTVAVHERVVGQLGALPARVTVHGVVAPAHRAETTDARLLHERLDLRQITRGALGQRVAAVQKRVHDHVGGSLAAGHLQACLKVPHVAVHAAVGDEAQQVQRGASSHRLRERVLEHAVGEERAILDGLGDAREVLVNDAAGADVQVPDLGVAHLARRQPHGRPRGLKRAVRVRGQQTVERGGTRLADGIAGTVRGYSPAVHDHQHDRPEQATDRGKRRVARLLGRQSAGRFAGALGLVHAGSAKPAMRANSSASRLAPPTSTPSMSGCAISSSMLAAFTLPP